jgi:hypothetical protein
MIELELNDECVFKPPATKVIKPEVEAEIAAFLSQYATMIYISPV